MTSNAATVAAALDAHTDPYLPVRVRDEVRRLDDLSTLPAAAELLCRLALSCPEPRRLAMIVRLVCAHCARVPCR